MTKNEKLIQAQKHLKQLEAEKATQLRKKQQELADAEADKFQPRAAKLREDIDNIHKRYDPALRRTRQEIMDLTDVISDEDKREKLANEARWSAIEAARKDQARQHYQGSDANFERDYPAIREQMVIAETMSGVGSDGRVSRAINL